MLFLDTNVFIRFIVRDNAAHAQEALELIETLTTRAVEATTCEGVILEIEQVLSSKNLYGMGREEIRNRMAPLLNLPGLRLEHGQVYRDALDRYAASNLDFVDCLIVEHMANQGVTALVSFDRDFSRVPSVQRLEPRDALNT